MTQELANVYAREGNYESSPHRIPKIHSEFSGAKLETKRLQRFVLPATR
jgi:hypothetical protein